MENYERLKLLGKGSFGKAYLIRHKQENKLWCVKTIQVRNMPAKEKKAVKLEIKMLEKLNHPNIVGYKDNFLTKSRATMCIVMTYCDGGDLDQLLNRAKNRGGLSTAKSMGLFVQIALGLHYLHSKSVMHRDLKPQNCFLLGNGR